MYVNFSGLICKIVHGMKVTLDGDGGFTYHHHQDVHQQLIFKPVSVQALWTVIQTLHMIGERLRPVNNNPEEDDWIHEYKGEFILKFKHLKKNLQKKLFFSYFTSILHQ